MVRAFFAGATSFQRLAEGIGASNPRLRKCMAAKETEDAVRSDVRMAQTIGITATPGFVVGANRESGRITGRALRGAFPIEEFVTAIAAAQAQRSGASDAKRPAGTH